MAGYVYKMTDRCKLSKIVWSGSINDVFDAKKETPEDTLHIDSRTVLSNKLFSGNVMFYFCTVHHSTH